MGKKRHAKIYNRNVICAQKRFARARGGKSSYFQEKATSAMIVLFWMRFA